MTVKSKHTIANMFGDCITGTEGTRAVRMATDGSDINVDSTSNSLDGYVGKASGTNGDFTVAYASATTITCSSLPSDVGSLKADDIVSIVQVASDGSVTNTYTRDDITLTASGTDPTTLTIAGATFAATDTFVVYTNIARINIIRAQDDASLVDLSSTDQTFTAPNIPNCLYIGTGGDIKVDTIAGTTITIPDIVDGYELKILVTKIYKVGTTASNITAFHK